VRIAFVSPNRERLPDPVPPLGILYMMSAAGAGHEKTLIDLCFEEDPLGFLGRQLTAFAPDLVAVGMRNIQNADYSDTRTTLAYYDQVVRVIREHCVAPVVMGGGGFSIIPKELMARYDLDFGVVGEGEQAFAMLVSRIADGSNDVAGIPNLLSRNGDALQSGPARLFLDLRSSAAPDRSWVDPRYYEYSGVAPIQTKRGCVMRCEYCTYPLIEGREFRHRPPETVADEWQEMLVQGPAIAHVFIVDSVFNLPDRRARELCETLVTRGLQTPWTCYVNPVRFDQGLADAMARAGCTGVEIGADSGTDQGLARLQKGFKTADIRQVGLACRQAGIKDCHTFVLGTRGDTLDDVERSLDFLEELDPFSAILMAYKDDREAVDCELAARMAAFRGQVLEAIERRAQTRTRWSVPSLGLRFDPRIFGRLRKMGLKGPLWQHVQ
jgi:radical SAM superfamily enzyme YgiQ (UPF0313 family)